MPRRLNYVIQETSAGSHSFIVQRHDLRGACHLQNQTQGSQLGSTLDVPGGTGVGGALLH